MSDNYKNTTPYNFKEEGNSLIYKDHEAFFQRFHELRANLTECLGLSLFQENQLKRAVELSHALILWTSIYISKTGRTAEVDNLFKEILKSHDTDSTRDNLNKLFITLNEIYEFSELIPQVKEVEKDNEDIDILTKHALAAYKIINCVK